MDLQYIQYCIHYMHVYGLLSLTHEMNTTGCKIFGARMGLGPWILEVAREARWWGATSCSSCPWGALAFLALLVFLSGAAVGICGTLLVVSVQCRRALTLLLSFAANCLGAGIQPTPPSLSVRLSQYRRDQ